jgi:hypothetical protein
VSKGCENHCNLLKQANDTIRKMAEWIELFDSKSVICEETHKLYNIQLLGKCPKAPCADCIIKYFEGLEDK